MNQLPPINVDVAKPITALVEKVCEGIGGYLAPFQIVRIANAEAKAAEIKAKSDALVATIQTDSNIEVNEKIKRVALRLMSEESRKQDNIESITAKAIEDLEKDAKPENIDNDWIANFFDKCKLVSDEEMQNIWGKVLSGEANSPGKFSKRTVEFIATMSKDDAIMFQSLCSFGWFLNERVVLLFDENKDVYRKNNINFKILKHLEGIGLINYTELGFSVTNREKVFISSYFKSPIILDLSKVGSLNVGRVMLTQIGNELLSLVNSTPNTEFFDYVLHKWYRDGIILHSYYPYIEVEPNKPIYWLPPSLVHLISQ